MLSFITRHWRGEISFVKSFWLVLILGNGLLSAVEGALKIEYLLA
jgi:hypothetical protein